MKSIKYNKQLYIENVNKIKSDIYPVKFNEIESLGLLGTYLMISANLSAFLPQLKIEDHYKMIQNIQFQRSLSSLDQYFFYILNELKISDDSNVLAKSRKEGHIFVTYHTGSYRLFIQHLNKENIPFCLVTEGDYVKDQGETTQMLFKKLNGNQKELEILPAENPRLIFELTRRLRKGQSVVFYIDGNKGASSKDLNDNKNLLKMDFLSKHIYARQGIAFLSYISKAPLVTAVSKRDSELNNSICIKQIELSELQEKSDRHEFVNRVTKILYNELEVLLKCYPEQWEGWFYIDKFFQQESNALVDTPETKLDLDLPGPVTLMINKFLHLIKHGEDTLFLVDRKNYKIMAITQFVYEVLSYFKSPRKIASNKTLNIADYKVKWADMEELVKMDYLKQVI